MEAAVNDRIRNIALAAVVPALFLAACDRSPTEPPDHHQLGTVVILDRATTPRTVLATWTHTGGWDRQDLMTISHSTEANRTRVSLGAQMFTRGGEEITLSSAGEYSLRYGVHADPAGVIDMNVAASLFHGDHIHLYGFHLERRTGTAEVVFALWHGDHDDGVTSPIRVNFVD
jgi:hypothetical protein